MLCISTIVCLVASVTSAQACTKTWGSSSGSWGEANDWTPHGVPTNTDDVCITASGTYTVTLPPEGGQAASLTLGGSSGTQTIDVAGASYIYQGETQHVTSLSVGTATIASTGRIVLDATSGGTRSGSEEFGAGGYLTAGTVTNSGQIETQVQDSQWDDYFKVGNLTNESGGSVQIASGTLNSQQEGEGAYPWSETNNGTVTVAGGASWLMKTSFAGKASFTNDGSIVNDGSIAMDGSSGEAIWTQSGGSISGNEAVLQNGATLADSAGLGAFLLNAAGAKITGTIPTGQTVTVRGEPFNYGGELYNSTALSLDNAQLVNDGTLVLEADGSTNTSGGSAYVNSGSLLNNGTILAEVNDPSWADYLEVGLTNAPGGKLELSGGTLNQTTGTPTINEGLTTLGPGSLYLLQEGSSFVNDGTLSPEIASASSIGSFQMSSPCCNGSGTFTGGGAVLPALVGGYVPSANQEFQVFLLTGGKFTGTFASVGNGFGADYSHESYETPSPNYVGLVYQASGGGTTGGGSTVAKGIPPIVPLVDLVSAAGGRGNLSVTLSCPPGGMACQAASVTATVTEHLKGGKITAVSSRKSKKKARAQTKQVVIAAASATLAAGTTKALTLALDAAGRALLDKYGKLTTVVSVTSAGKAVGNATVTVKKPAKAKKK
ncbi:MAG TPA: hypothetical protein VN845_10200 [Solirubrobacteraceae bacterium]|nr:hypothetical protein [Solirubrobacteraceae bacterium]